MQLRSIERLGEVSATVSPRLRLADVAPDGGSAATTVARRSPSADFEAVREGHPRSAAAGTAFISGMTLAAGDAVTFAASGLIVLPFGSAAGPMPQTLAVVAAGAVWLMALRGLYPGQGVFDHEILKRRVTAIATIAVLAVTAAELFSGWREAAFVAAFLVVALLMQLPMRGGLRSALHRAHLWGEPVTIVAEPDTAAALERYLATNWHLGFEPRPTNRGTRVALIGTGLSSRANVERLRLEHDALILLADLPGVPSSGLRLADTGGEIGLRLATMRRHERADRLRRMLDLLIATGALIAFGPILLLAAAAIYVVDPGSVLYLQTREGFEGRPFRILKLRSMYRDAEERLEALLQADPLARAEWTEHFKLRSDPRILPVVGNLLRRTSIDELPQLWNVIVGDMRIVGPRPFPDYHLSAMSGRFRRKRCTVRPGLSGLWQISERSTSGLVRQEMLDDYYIDNRSLWLDIDIIIKTAPAALRGTGAY